MTYTEIFEDEDNIKKLRDSIRPFDNGIYNAVKNADENENKMKHLLSCMQEWSKILPYQENLYEDASDIICNYIGEVRNEANIIADKVKLYLSERDNFLSGNPENIKDEFLQEYMTIYKGDTLKTEYFKKIDSVCTEADTFLKESNEIDNTLSYLDKDATMSFLYGCLDKDSKELFRDMTGYIMEEVIFIENRYSDIKGLRDELLNIVIDNAEKNLDDTISFINDNIDAFQMMDLKLHDASFYAYKDMENDFPLVYKDCNENDKDVFSDFCEDSFFDFKEWLKNEKYIEFDKIRKPVGRTSSFYLHDEGNGICLDRGNYYALNKEDTIYNLIDDLGYPKYDVRFAVDNEGKIKIDRDYVKQYIKDFGDVPNILYLSEGTFNDDVKKRYEDTLTVYEYIKDFKDKQVEYFKEYLKTKEEDLEYDMENNEEER